MVASLANMFTQINGGSSQHQMIVGNFLTLSLPKP